jgi:hypothetical protein
LFSNHDYYLTSKKANFPGGLAVNELLIENLPAPMDEFLPDEKPEVFAN